MLTYRGIEPVYSDPGRPDQNGRHERMHRELKAEACSPPGKNLQSQQVKFNRFKRIYNYERPHESLRMVTPVSAHENSKRPYLKEITDYSYPVDCKVKYVCRNGIIRVGKKDEVYVSNSIERKRSWT